MKALSPSAAGRYFLARTLPFWHGYSFEHASPDFHAALEGGLTGAFKHRPARLIDLSTGNCIVGSFDGQPAKARMCGRGAVAGRKSLSKK